MLIEDYSHIEMERWL